MGYFIKVIIAITGHTAGIGKILFDHYAKKYQVIGFSKSNGFDMDVPSQKEKIIFEISDQADVFINNAYSSKNRMAQIELLSVIYRNWKTQNKVIIVNSSLSPVYEKWNKPKEKMKEYSKSKQDISDQCEKYLWDYHSKCRVVDIKLGLVDTAFTKDFTASKMNAEELIPYFDLAIENKFLREMTVQCMS